VAKKEVIGEKKRARQVAIAQNAYRDRMRDEGFRRLQEWVPEGTMNALKALCELHGISQREAIIRSVKQELKSSASAEEA
jgi:DNA recombination-dependent growth factor C